MRFSRSRRAQQSPSNLFQGDRVRSTEGGTTMFQKTFSFAGTLLPVGAAVLMVPGLSPAQHGGGHGGGGHGGGGGEHFGGGGAHFAGRGAYFSGAHYGAYRAGMHLDGARYGGSHYGYARY